jgi:hypothetical protein
MRLAKFLFTIVAIASPVALSGEDKVDVRSYMAELARMGAKKPFLSDSPDVYLEPESLNRFFTKDIYRKLEGNAYFGYRFDEGFTCKTAEVRIEDIKDLTRNTGAAYRLALQRALADSGFTVKPKAACQIVICIVGVESRETDRTLPGVMVEAYLRNSSKKKSFFIRYGAGSPKGLAAALRLSAAMLVAELEARRERH